MHVDEFMDRLRARASADDINAGRVGLALRLGPLRICGDGCRVGFCVHDPRLRQVCLVLSRICLFVIFFGRLCELDGLRVERLGGMDVLA